MENEMIVAEQERVKQLENKIEELEKANLKLQEYFSSISDKLHSHERVSPFDGNPVFSCVFNFTLDLGLQKLVWLSPGIEESGYNIDKLFLADINLVAFRLISQIDKKRFLDIIVKYTQGNELSHQTLLRVNYPDGQSYFWVLATFEKVTYALYSENYVQIQFTRITESKEFSELFQEFANKSEKHEMYQRVEMLTCRQREVLSLLGKGFTSKEIAEMLSISFHTVEAHRKTIAKKTKTPKRGALISLAAEVGIIHQ